MYFYAVRKDKNGRALTTSYNKQEQAKKYGGSSAKIVKDIFYLDDNGAITKEQTGRILRSKLVSIAQESGGEGNFVLYSESNGKLTPTHFRFPTYGAANTGMKSLADVLGTLVVVEEREPSAEGEDDEVEHDAQEIPVF